MSRGIAVHVVAGILFVGVATPDAQESTPRPAVVDEVGTRTRSGVLPTANDVSLPATEIRESRVAPRMVCVDDTEGEMGATITMAPHIRAGNPNDNAEQRQIPAKSPEEANDSPQARTGTARRWFTGAMLGTLEFVVQGLYVASGR